MKSAPTYVMYRLDADGKPLLASAQFVVNQTEMRPDGDGWGWDDWDREGQFETWKGNAAPYLEKLVAAIPDEPIGAVIGRAYAWFAEKYPEAEPTSAEVILAVAKPSEETGELLGAYIKWRRNYLRTGGGAAAGQLWREMEDEVADSIICPIMSAKALGISPQRLLKILALKLDELEDPERGADGRHR